MSYNVGAQSEKRLAAIVDVIRDQNPDVVALLDPETQALADAFAHKLGMRAYYGEGNHGWGIAWLTRLPAQRTENHKLAMFHNLMELLVLWRGRPVHLFATHLRGLGAESQVGVEARLRTEETRAILDILRPFNSEPLLVVGDFNASRPGERAGEPPPPAPNGGPTTIIAFPPPGSQYNCFSNLGCWIVIGDCIRGRRVTRSEQTTRGAASTSFSRHQSSRLGCEPVTS